MTCLFVQICCSEDRRGGGIEKNPYFFYMNKLPLFTGLELTRLWMEGGKVKGRRQAAVTSEETLLITDLTAGLD